MTALDPELRDRAAQAADEAYHSGCPVLDCDEHLADWGAVVDAVAQVLTPDLPAPDRRYDVNGARVPVWENVPLVGSVEVGPLGVSIEEGTSYGITPDKVEHAGRVLLAAAAHMRKGEQS